MKDAGSFLPLIIDDATRTRILSLKAYAEANPIPLARIAEFAAGRSQGDFYAPYRMEIPMGFPIIYTVEDQRQGRLRHLSVSVALPGRVPAREAVVAIMAELGFLLPLPEDADLLREDVAVLDRAVCFEDGIGVRAINVVEPSDGDWRPFLVKRRA